MLINIKVLMEQDGETERQFKQQLVDLFHASGKRLRAYLAVVQYEDEQATHVALMIKAVDGEDESLINNCNRIFGKMFATNQHLDIVMLSDGLEEETRKTCCPFYTSPDFNVTKPDFYLYSRDGYHLDDVIRNCYMRARLYSSGETPDGFMLCDIAPPLNDLQHLIISSKGIGTSLFPISYWPFPIYVLRSLIEDVPPQAIIDQSNSELIALALLYERKEDVILQETGDPNHSK